VFVGVVEVSSSFFGDVDSNLWDLRVEHLLQADRLRDDLSKRGKDVARATSTLVLDRKEAPVLVLFDGVCDPVQPQSLAHQRDAMMDDGPTPMVRSTSVDPLVAGGALNREVVVGPHAVRKQVSLARAVGIVLERRDA
jgi:hypothetical protein